MRIWSWDTVTDWWRSRFRRPARASLGPAPAPPGSLRSLTGRPFVVRLVADAAAVAALCFLAGLTFVLAWGSGWVWVTAIGAIIGGIAIGVAGALWAWRAIAVAGAAIGAYLLAGGFLAMPSTTIAGFIPTGYTLQHLLVGAVTSWRASLTVEPPIGETGSLLVVPLITLLVAATVSTSVALRTDRIALGCVPPAIAGIVGIAFGTAFAFLPALVALGFGGVSLAWTADRRSRRGRALLRNRSRAQWPTVVVGALVLVVAMGSVLALQPVLAPQSVRSNLRAAVEPPLDLTAYPSPLQAFRANIARHKDDVLLTVTGLPEDAVVRLATMDAYDGFSMRVSNSVEEGADAGTFSRVGQKIDTVADGTPVPVTVEIRDYAGPWVPTVGETRSVTFTGDRRLALGDSFYYNKASGTGLTTSRLQSGDTYTLEAIVDPVPADDQVKRAQQGRFELPAADPIPDAVRDAAQRWTRTAVSSGEAAQQLAAKLQQGYFSHGVERDEATSLPGHSYQRVQTLLADELRMVGDDEQYAVAMALMARHMGIPSRVVYGYKPSGSGGTVDIRGADVGAWTELYFTDLGWVTFDPTPDEDRKPQTEKDPDQVKPRPQVENPPPPPQRPDRLPPDNADPQPPIGNDDKPWRIDWRLVAGITAGVGLPLVVLILPVALIVGAKIRRRRARMSAPDVANRVAGGWAELTDMARDLGSTPSPYATRTEQADVITASFPEAAAGANPQVLARLADTTVFGPEEVSPAQAQTYWAGVDRAMKGMATSVAWWKRLFGRLSLRSFRRFRGL